MASAINFDSVRPIDSSFVRHRTNGGHHTTMAENEDITTTLDRWAAAEASGDAETIAQCLSEDFLGIGPLGFILPWREWLQRHDPGGLEYEKFELKYVHLRLYGDNAVVTALVEQPGTYRGNPIPQSTRSTLVLVKQGGQ